MPIRSGAMHYFRVLPEQWRERLTLLRAMGLDTVETYVPWNLHEPRPGRFDFSGLADLEGFLRTAADCGLQAIVRPGPYICAEWENGGLPVWLRAESEIPLRCSDPRYLAPVDAWFDELIPRIAAQQVTRGGNVIMVQVENEYGSYGSDSDYLRHLADGLIARGIDVPLITSDGPTELMLTGGTLPEVSVALNFGSQPVEAFDLLHRSRPDEAEFCMEFWNGWFDHFGLEHHTRDADDAAKVLDTMLVRGGSVNLYMAHGGTSFGFYAGANHDAEHGYQADVTSYDYDAPLTEDGRPSAKYWAFREVFGRYGELPPVPDVVVSRLPEAEVELSDRLPLLACVDVLSRGTRHSATPLSYEELGHDYGLAVYRTRVPGPRASPGEPFVVEGLRDRAHVLIDQKVVAILERDGLDHFELVTPDGGTEVTLVVEAMGRVNYGPMLGERKGVTGGARHGAQLQHGWEIDPLDLMRLTADSLPWERAGGEAGPAFFRGSLHVEEPRDGFLELPGGVKGYVWVNGFCLGRYWDRGPQRRLYLPWPLLHEGENEIVVLELDAEGPGGIGPLLVRGEPDLGK